MAKVMIWTVVLLTCVWLVPAGPSTAAIEEPRGELDRPLENRDVSSMVAAGIGESVVLSALEHAPREQLDATPEALEKLRESGLSQKLLAAIRARVEKRSATASDRVTDTRGDQGRAPTKPEDVKLYFSEKPSQRFKELGRVSAGKYSTFGRSRKREAIDGELREKAFELGGNAVINITEDFASISGVVVIFESK